MNSRGAMKAFAYVLGLGVISTAAAAPDQTRTVPVGFSTQIKSAGAQQWKTSDPTIAVVFGRGFIVGLKPGTATITDGASGEFPVAVVEGESKLEDPGKFQQYPENQVFTDAAGRKCVGTELNAHMAGNEQEPRVDRNRVLDLEPGNPSKPLMWQVEPQTPVLDGTGVLMGTVAASIEMDGKQVPATMFNYGMSKIIHGQFCVYAFSVKIIPSAAVKPLIEPEAGHARESSDTVSTSAWVPLDKVVKKDVLVEAVGIGHGKLPHVPLEDKQFVISGGDPKMYLVDGKELGITKSVSGAVPSHYLRRPSGTVNIEYCVPGFSIGGQNLDSLLITSHAVFRPAKGVRQFVMPTYYPKGHPQEGKKSAKTETFIYGAVDAPGTEVIYGWVAKEALVEEK